MGRLKQGILLIRLIEELRDHSAHCTEPRLQASAFFLQEAAGVPLALTYTLYKRRVYSFELYDALTALRADGLIKCDPRRKGSHFLPTQNAERFKRLYPITLSQYEKSAAAVADELAGRPIRDLQALAAALFITRTTPAEPHAHQQRLATLRLCIPPLDPAGALRKAARLAKALRQASETFSAPHS